MTARLLLLVIAGAATLAACGSSGPPPDPRAELTTAKAKVDAASALHFALSSENAGGSDVYVNGGDGDAARPDGFSGNFDVYYKVGIVKVGVASSGGTFYVKLPFGGGFSKADPSQYGFSDPGGLLNPTTGLSSLLVKAKTATADGQDRFNGEQLDEVKVTLPGDLVQHLLTSADPSKDVDGEVGIAPGGEVRRVKLTGPFFAKGKLATYTVVLTGYGEHVTITPPPT